MPWKKNRFGMTALKKVCGSALLFLLCGLCVLSHSLPASAIDFDRNQVSLSINGVDTPNSCTIDSSDFGGGNYRGGWRCVSPSSAQNTTFRIKFNRGMPSTYGNLIFVSMAVHGHDSDITPLAFTGDPYATVLWSEVTGDNTNFTVQGLFYARADWSSLTLYSDSAMNFKGNIAIGVNTPRAVGLNKEPTYDQLEQIKTSLSNLSSVSQDIYDKLDDIEDLVQAGLVCNGTIGSGLTVEDHTGSTPSVVQNVGDIFSDSDYYASICQNSLMSFEYIQTNALLNIMKKIDAQQTQALQDEQDRENIQDQQDDIADDASDVSDDVSSATSTLSQNVSLIIGAFSTNASDCLISVTTGDQGVLQLTNMNVCSLPTEIHNLIHTVVAIIITVAVLMISFNLINQVVSLIEEFYGTPGGKLWI